MPALNANVEDGEGNDNLKKAGAAYGVYTLAKIATLPIAIMIWQGIDVNDLPDSIEDVGNIEVRAIRKLKLNTYKNFCTESNGGNDKPCKYLFGDDIFTKAGQRDIINKIEISDPNKIQISELKKLTSTYASKDIFPNEQLQFKKVSGRI